MKIVPFLEIRIKSPSNTRTPSRSELLQYKHALNMKGSSTEASYGKSTISQFPWQVGYCAPQTKNEHDPVERY